MAFQALNIDCEDEILNNELLKNYHEQTLAFNIQTNL